MRADYTFEAIIAEYKRLLADRPGEALEVGDCSYAVMVGDDVRLAMIDANGNVRVDAACEFLEEYWDQDCESWEGASTPGESIACILNPSYIKIAD